MALNPIAYTESVVRSFLRYQLTAYPFADPRLNQQMRDLLSLDQTRQSPLLKGPYISLSRPFRQGATVEALVDEGLLHSHLGDRISREISHLYSHQERAIRGIASGQTTLVSTGTGSGKTECFLYPIISQCLKLQDEGASAGICAVIVYPMNALAEDQLVRLRRLLAGSGISFGIYVGKTPEGEADVAGVRLPPHASRATYLARLDKARSEGSGETVYPAEEVCSRQIMRTPGRQPRILLTNVKQLELLLTRQQDVELFADARLDFLVFDEAHTFTGALGAETACLIRRLRAFCGAKPERTTCIAASATIADENDPEPARKFAARFFGVSPSTVAVVREDYEAEVWNDARTVPPDPGSKASDILNEVVRAVEQEDDSGRALQAAYRALPTDEPSANLDTDSDGNWLERLHSDLSRNELVFRLNEELSTPQALEALPSVLERHVGRPVSEFEILYWLTLGAAAHKQGRPLLRPVVHSFVRGIGGAVVTFSQASDEPRLWLAAEDKDNPQAPDENHAHLPVRTCTTCGQHYFTTFLKDFRFAGSRPGGGEASARGIWWEPLEEKLQGRRVVLVDRLIGEDDDSPPTARTAPLYFCRRCGAAHPEPLPSCLSCGTGGSPVKLLALRQRKDENPGRLTSCLSCGAAGRQVAGRYREPARPVRAINVADVHVLAQDMVHHAERQRLLVFCDNRQDAAFQAGWMKDHARRFRLRALMADGIRASPSSVGDLVGTLDDQLEGNEALSRALVPEVWQVARREGSGGRHQQERRKFLRFQVLREITLSPRQALGLEPWGRMRVEYEGLEASLPWIQDNADILGIPPDDLKEGVASLLDYFRRNQRLYDPEYETFTKYWHEGAREVQQGYLPKLSPKGVKLRREASDKPELVSQWLSERGDTPVRQLARRWGVRAESIEAVLESLFDLLVQHGFLVSVRLKGSKGRPLPNSQGVYQVNADCVRLEPHHGLWRCKSCRRSTPRDLPRKRCPFFRCNGRLEWVREDKDNYNLQLVDEDYSMLRPEEHTAMVPNDERERLENLFKSTSDAVNCLVCTPTLELGIDIGQLDSVLMRNVPPLPANYWQRAGRAGRRHRMAVDFTYCRPVSHDRAYFGDPRKLLAGKIDPPVFNLRNEVMVAKHVNATVIASLRRYSRDPGRAEAERRRIRETLEACLPQRVASYLFRDARIRNEPFDFSALHELVAENAQALTADTLRVFEQGWPEEDADVTDVEVLGAHINAFVSRLEGVVGHLQRRLRWAMTQIRRLDGRRESQGTLEPADEALFRRCDNLVKQLKGRGRRRGQAEGHDDFNTFNVLAAEGFLPGYGLEVGSVVGWADIPFWRSGAMDFFLPRPPATALREYVPGNLIYANGHRFVARVFHLHREIGEEHAEVPHYEVSAASEAVKETAAGAGSQLGSHVIPAMAVSDTDLIHSSHISDEEELRFQLGVAIYGLELGQHNGGTAYRWGSQPLHLRRGVRIRLVNVGPSAKIRTNPEFGYPVCTVCGQSTSPLSTSIQLEKFWNEHKAGCGCQARRIGFYADVVADALSLSACNSASTAYSTLEALRFGATRVLDMHMEDLQVLVIGHLDRDDFDALLWDPMQGGSGLLDRLRERFDAVVEAAMSIVCHCPGRCESSCNDCLQTFRNAYYHRHLDRVLACGQLKEWGSQLSFEYSIPPAQPATTPDDQAMPVNDAETKLRHLLLAAGFGEGTRGEQIRLSHALGTTTPDVVFRTEDHHSDEGVCIYLDGLSAQIHGDPQIAARDLEIRDWLRNSGYDVIEITANQLDDEQAMTRHFRRLALYLGMRDVRNQLTDNRSWFHGKM